MAKTRKKTAAVPVPDTFFGEYLGGENPLKISTARMLVEAAETLQEIGPWELIEETDLMFLGGQSGEPLSVCSVIGSLGESFAFFAYIGGSSYFEFRDMQEERTPVREFFARQHSVRVEFDNASELTKPDRDLLRATGFKARRGEFRPVFRTIRPHYSSWYPTEGEAQLLLLSLAGFLALFKGEELPDYWVEKGVYPVVELKGGDGDNFAISLLRPPEPVLEVPAADIDEERLRRILSHNHRRGGALEVDCFHLPGRVGGPKERPMWPRAAVVLDAKTGIAFPPDTLDAEVDDWDAAARVLFEAMESGAPIPNEIAVSNPTLEIALEPMAKALGSKLVRRKRLAKLDEFREAMMAHFGPR